jgi:hypothetical protein
MKRTGPNIPARSQVVQPEAVAQVALPGAAAAQPLLVALQKSGFSAFGTFESLLL